MRPRNVYIALTFADGPIFNPRYQHTIFMKDPFVFLAEVIHECLIFRNVNFPRVVVGHLSVKVEFPCRVNIVVRLSQDIW